MPVWNNIIKRRKPFGGLSDEALIARFRNSGDNELVGILFERYYHLVLGLSLKYLHDEEDAKEAAMQVFEQLFVSLKQFEISYFKSWLYSVAKNHCLMLLRKKAPTVRVDTLHYQNLGDEFMEFADEISLRGNGTRGSPEKNLEEALDKLNDEQKLCIELFYLKDKSYKEVAEITNFTMNQVKSFIQNGKRNLKILLSKES